MKYLYIWKGCKNIYKANDESRSKSVVSRYIKKQSLQEMSNGLESLDIFKKRIKFVNFTSPLVVSENLQFSRNQ